ncbi:hypothetical protein [Methanobacterium sp.]|uniref:hypothetical protein n=1 Tax=Methanobacterium sp. TaxID=2164 RepID=UPI003C717EB8
MGIDSKGQASAELILATVVFMVIALSLIQLASSEMDKTDTGNLGQVRMIGESISETINTVYIRGPGYSANLTLPDSPANYTVYVSNGNLNISYHGNSISIKLIPTKVQTFTMTNNGTSYQVMNNNRTIQFK